MSFQNCLIVERDSEWWIAAGDATDTIAIDASADELATCVDVVVKQSGLKNPQCVLAPASTSCFFATLPLTEDIDIRDRSALTYELEDHLPIDAESMVADFSVVPSTSDPKTVSAVAIETRRWHSIAEALEERGLPVRSIVPAAVLLTRSLCRELNLTDTVELVLADDKSCDLITVNAETILVWKHAGLDPKLLQRHRSLMVGQTNIDRTLAIGAAPDEPAIRQAYPDVEFVPTTTEECMIHGAELTLSKHADHWFDLRRDTLGPSDPLRAIQTHLRVATVAAALFLIVLATGGWWRGQQIEAEIGKIQDQQRELFEKTFPNTRIRGDVAFRVRREHRSLMGLRGATNQNLDVPVSAPMVLREVMAALPTETPFRLKTIRVEDGHVVLDVEVRQFLDAGEISDALSQAGFVVQPPQISKKEQGDQSVGSMLEADWIGGQQNERSSEADRASVDRKRRVTGVSG
ncbi:MAG: GspL/Epsl periplasmic domain-containing protein [Rubripirellula sp.]